MDWVFNHLPEILYGSVITALAVVWRMQITTLTNERDWLRKELDEEQEAHHSAP